MPAPRLISLPFAVLVRWPLGMALTSWAYLWRTTPMYRRERRGSLPRDAGPSLPDDLSRADLQPPASGYGPLFHRRYVARVRDPALDADELMALIKANPDDAAPSGLARFAKTKGAAGTMAIGDEFRVRMAGPWDGPVRVVELSATSFRFATLRGHLEAGQIEFEGAEVDGCLELRIESWARSGDRVAKLLYADLRMAKEIQLHMWTSFLERATKLSGGRLAAGIEIETRTVEAAAVAL